MVLCLAVALFAANGPAESRGTAMVICADGVAETIYLDADGTPIEPGTECCDCHDCNMPNLIAILADRSDQAMSYPLRLSATMDPVARIFVSDISRPMPRGPPLPQVAANARAWRVCVPVTLDRSEVLPGDYSQRGGALFQGLLT